MTCVIMGPANMVSVNFAGIAIWLLAETSNATLCRRERPALCKGDQRM